MTENKQETVQKPVNKKVSVPSPNHDVTPKS